MLFTSFLYFMYLLYHKDFCLSTVFLRFLKFPKTFDRAFRHQPLALYFFLYLMYLLQQIFFYLSILFLFFIKIFSAWTRTTFTPNPITYQGLKMKERTESNGNIGLPERHYYQIVIFPLDNYNYIKYFFICKVQILGESLCKLTIKKCLTKVLGCGIIEFSSRTSCKRLSAARHYTMPARICQEFFEKNFA